MAYFADLEPCTYYGEPSDPLRLVAVGWLDAEHPFTAGRLRWDVYDRLKTFAEMRWKPLFFFGGHECELCLYDPFCSNHDLFIPGDGVIYAVPVGIIHYVACHHYLPPEEFCEAVMQCPDPDTPEFFAAMHANGWSSARLPWHDYHAVGAMDTLASAYRALAEARVAAMDAGGRGVEALGRLHDNGGTFVDTLKWTYWRGPSGMYRVRGLWRVGRVDFACDTDAHTTTYQVHGA
jgi:hypothetical protein